MLKFLNIKPSGQVHHKIKRNKYTHEVEIRILLSSVIINNHPPSPLRSKNFNLSIPMAVYATKQAMYK